MGLVDVCPDELSWMEGVGSIGKNDLAVDLGCLPLGATTQEQIALFVRSVNQDVECRADKFGISPGGDPFLQRHDPGPALFLRLGGNVIRKGSPKESKTAEFCSTVRADMNRDRTAKASR